MHGSSLGQYSTIQGNTFPPAWITSTMGLEAGGSREQAARIMVTAEKKAARIRLDGEAAHRVAEAEAKVAQLMADAEARDSALIIEAEQAAEADAIRKAHDSVQRSARTAEKDVANKMLAANLAAEEEAARIVAAAEAHAASCISEGETAQIVARAEARAMQLMEDAEAARRAVENQLGHRRESTEWNLQQQAEAIIAEAAWEGDKAGEEWQNPDLERPTQGSFLASLWRAGEFGVSTAVSGYGYSQRHGRVACDCHGYPLPLSKEDAPMPPSAPTPLSREDTPLPSSPVPTTLTREDTPLPSPVPTPMPDSSDDDECSNHLNP
jgi:hypothetical protein